MKNKKLVIVTTVPATLFSLLSNQIPQLQTLNYSISLITSSGAGWITIPDVVKKYGLPVFTIPLSRTISLGRDIVSIFRLFLLLRRIKPDIIHYSTPKAALIASVAAFLVRIPRRIYTVRGMVYYNKHGFARFVLIAAEKVTCLLSHTIISVSESNKHELVRNHVCAPEKLVMLCHGSSQGVDANNRFNPAAISQSDVRTIKQGLRIEDTVVVYGVVGRLTKEKGIDELLTAWQDVKKSITPCILLVVGKLEKNRTPLSLETTNTMAHDSSIIVTGHVDKPEIYYSFMNVLVHPSHREGFPNAVLEAAAMRVPAITTDAVGCRDSVVDGDTGFIIPVRDSQALAQRMIFLGQNSAVREKMGANARQRVVSCFDPKLICNALVDLYDNPRRQKVGS